MVNKIKLIVGFDQLEAVAYHTFCQSVLDKSTLPVEFLPLAKNTLFGYEESHPDGSNAFIYSRFLSPYLCDYRGWAIFVDGDMVCRENIKNLWDLRDNTKAVQVVKHSYKTKFPKKYLGNKNEDYPRKNWSSLILWNCEHPANSILTPRLIEKSSGGYLHRFSWLSDDLIGELPIEWNWLALEYAENREAKIIHYTVGTPCFKDYANKSMSSEWQISYLRSQSGFD
jgi:lipopolysaccharide biosynthesis glycosyltransferase